MNICERKEVRNTTKVFDMKNTKHKIQIANILLTRRCNLQCDYCNIVKNYTGRPSEYKDMNYLRSTEFPATEWSKVFDRIHKNNPGCFFILYGGEPLLHPDIINIIKYMKDNFYPHTIISNNTPVVRKRIEEVYKTIGTLPGFTASIDPELCLYLDKKNVTQNDAIKKSIAGFEYLKYLKENGLADDVVAEITVSNSNINYLYETVKILTKNDIHASITTIDDQKSRYYDFSNIIANSDLMVKPDSKTRMIFDQIQNDKSLKVHMSPLLDELFNVLPANMACDIYKDIHNVTVDSDMTFRLCLRIAGVECGKIKVTDGIDENGVITDKMLQAFECDYKKYCQKCNWTCMLMSKYFSDRIVTH